ncbi:hypothetical protein JMUB7481_27140 [Staphylococcus aureus]
MSGLDLWRILGFPDNPEMEPGHVRTPDIDGTTRTPQGADVPDTPLPDT